MNSSEVYKIVAAVVVSALGATGMNVALTPTRDEIVYHDEWIRLAAQVAELRSELRLLRYEFKTRLPPEKTKQRIEGIEDFLGETSKYKPPHRNW